MSSGYVFVLSNPLYGDYVYVGTSSKTPKEKAQELYSEGVLHPFEIIMAKTVTSIDTKLVTLHKLLGKLGERPNPDKDFFKVDRDVLEHLTVRIGWHRVSFPRKPLGISCLKK